MLQKRVFNIIWITKNKPGGLDFEQQPSEQITYDGKKQVIRMK
jgi:hypothetical protein